jgi:hypothetical protein
MLLYDDFIKHVNEAGFWTPFTNYIDQEIFTFAYDGNNPKGQNYTNDPDTDPELWKTRAAQEKKLAYGYFFNGKPGGYIAPNFYSIFIDAFRPRMTIEERYEAGKLGEYEYNIWNLLSQHATPQSWTDLRRKLGLEPAVKYKTAVSRLDKALKNLQMTFDITVDGTVGHLGCDKVDNWIPSAWLEMNPRMEQQEALKYIYRQAEKISNPDDAKKAFAKSLKLYKESCW